MPAAAVIPAPLAYTIIVAVKRLVVGLNNNIVFIRIYAKFDNTLNVLILFLIIFNTVNKSECIKHVVKVQ